MNKPSKTVLKDNAEEMYKLLVRLVTLNKAVADDLGDFLAKIDDISVDAATLIENMKENST